MVNKWLQLENIWIILKNYFKVLENDIAMLYYRKKTYFFLLKMISFKYKIRFYCWFRIFIRLFMTLLLNSQFTKYKKIVNTVILQVAQYLNLHNKYHQFESGWCNFISRIFYEIAD